MTAPATTVPMECLVWPEELAKAVAFPASVEASFITGV